MFRHLFHINLTESTSGKKQAYSGLMAEDNQGIQKATKKPDKEWKNVSDDFTRQCKLKDRYEVDLVNNYLIANGGLMLAPVSTSRSI
jgi:hypothetical protein